jgi:hypothetical protein
MAHQVEEVGRPYAGMDVYHVADPAHPKEAGRWWLPGTRQINDVYVDENGLIYANDRLSGGLDIVTYTGPVPLQYS